MQLKELQPRHLHCTRERNQGFSEQIKSAEAIGELWHLISKKKINENLLRGKMKLLDIFVAVQICKGC